MKGRTELSYSLIAMDGQLGGKGSFPGKVEAMIACHCTNIGCLVLISCGEVKKPMQPLLYDMRSTIDSSGGSVLE